ILETEIPVPAIRVEMILAGVSPATTVLETATRATATLARATQAMEIPAMAIPVKMIPARVVLGLRSGDHARRC
ncbi:hypothetical protein, partial [Brevundimonas sp. 374]|uniref:hypothetical protein n=1 Tax=Brevundimonas sp. 374 TaxID=1150400 RepID=UPI001C409748